jgi:hypothetical protein
MSFSPFDKFFHRTKTLHPGSFPRRIYSLWIQGESSAPDLVKFNWDRWSHLNPDFELVILDEQAALGHIGDFSIDPRCLTPQAFSDVLRAKLLASSGGIWIDASVFPVVPLADWIDRSLDGCSFFAYAAPADDRPIASWFLAARETSLIMSEWWGAVCSYWDRPRKLARNEKRQIVIPENPVEAVSPESGAKDNQYYYYWFHYLFSYLCSSNKKFRSAWQKCARKSANPPHALQRYLRLHPGANAAQITTQARLAEMQKLNLRFSYPLEALAQVAYRQE